MNQKQKWLIPATESIGFNLSAGQTVRVIDVEGQQVADFIAYVKEDIQERLDPGVTLDVLRSFKMKEGDYIYSNRYRPLLKVVKDTVGQHDFINPACRSEMYELLYQKSNHKNCYDNLNRALNNFQIQSPKQYYPLNLFMNTKISSSGKISIERPLSKAGDFTELRAEVDLIVAISACPCAESACNGYHCTSIQVEIT
ncbi:urea carboxylase-associated family protein [Bacillus horti]|uniref:Uncharacterized protein YcgI (DUF1989 family) n=1 Tax=Caldalkalibacillus horti TaxID=77523 RepID=A0ABT9VY24_9BACI|nr:urea carboxylase-associated family protein [Bacillus horti]MDQ0165882.1 uncharacterized protein YcgI (DUF1989 family) [Bacillus horti]